MPRIKAIEARLPVADVVRSAGLFAMVLGFEISALWAAAGTGVRHSQTIDRRA